MEELLTYYPAKPGESKAEHVRRVLHALRTKTGYQHPYPYINEAGYLVGNLRWLGTPGSMAFDDTSLYSVQQDTTTPPGDMKAVSNFLRRIGKHPSDQIYGSQNIDQLRSIAIDQQAEPGTAESTIRISKEIEDTNPIAAAWIKNKRPTMVINHPGQIITQTRRDFARIGVDPRHWRRISRLDPEIFDHLIKKDLRANTLGIVLNAIGRYQVEGLDRRSIDLARFSLQPYENHVGGVPSPNERQNMEQYVGVILRTSVDPDTVWREREHFPEGWHEVHDYVNSQISRNQPITATTWGGLVRASDEWHRNRVHEQIRQQIEAEASRNEGLVRGWNSLTDAREYTTNEGTRVFVRPLTDSSELRREGLEMHHCVGSYGNQCQSGQSRIFALRSEDGTRLTMEIVKNDRRYSSGEDGKWRVNQIQGQANRETIPAEMQRLAETIRDDYQEAWDQTPADERTQQIWVYPEGDPRRDAPEPEYEGEDNAEEHEQPYLDIQNEEIPRLELAPEELRADADRFREGRVDELRDEQRGELGQQLEYQAANPREPRYLERRGRGRLR